MERHKSDSLFLKSWMRSESGQHSDVSFPLQWIFVSTMKQVMPILYSGDIELLGDPGFIERVVVEWKKRNK